MIECEKCKVSPITGEEKFFNVRFTKTGKYYDDDVEDLVLCKECLESRDLDKLQSVVRIENLEMG